MRRERLNMLKEARLLTLRSSPIDPTDLTGRLSAVCKNAWNVGMLPINYRPAFRVAGPQGLSPEYRRTPEIHVHVRVIR